MEPSQRLERLERADYRATLSSTPFQRRDVLIVSCYLALYLVLEHISLVHQFAGLGLTLWNPPPALSLALLLTFGFRYVPGLFVAAILAGEILQIAPGGWTAKLMTSAVLAGGYAALAVLLRTLRADLEASVLSRTIHVLVIVPAGVLVIAVVYCGALVLTDALSPARFAGAVRHFWIGDTIGIITLLPALLAGSTVHLQRLKELDRGSLWDGTIFVLGVCVALAVIFGRKSINEFQFFSWPPRSPI